MNKTIDTFDNVTTDEMCPQLLEMVTQLQKENKELKEENGNSSKIRLISRIW